MLHMTKTLSPLTKPPRVSVPVSADVLAVFDRLAKAGNMSTGRAMAEWLADTVEAAELMASTMERARAAPKLVTAELHAMMLGMADQTKELADKFSKFRGPLGGEPDSAGGKRSATASAGSLTPFPPSGNTGGKGTKKDSTVSSTVKAKARKPRENLKVDHGFKFPLPAGKVQAYADTNGVPPKVIK